MYGHVILDNISHDVIYEVLHACDLGWKVKEDAYAFYRDYAMRANGPILEPMCGTGRFLLPLLEEGFNVHGFDASDHMLKVLHAKAKTKKLDATVWKGFVEDLKRPEKYNLIFIPSGSFCLIIDPAAVKSALKKLYHHLSDDGVLLFEGETLKAVPPLVIFVNYQDHFQSINVMIGV